MTRGHEPEGDALDRRADLFGHTIRPELIKLAVEDPVQERRPR